MSEPTKAPWKVEPVYVSEESYEIAHYYIEGGNERRDTVADNIPNVADANLIAAAPELYAALKEVRDGVHASMGRWAATYLIKVDRLLSKAEGA